MPAIAKAQTTAPRPDQGRWDFAQRDLPFVILTFPNLCEITTEMRSLLLPDRQGQDDFFVCDIFDAAPKGDMASMAHPIFSLSTKPDHRIRRYENETGKSYLEVKPSADGLATIHDRDVLIYCISQIMAAINQGQQVSHTVRLKAYDLLKATNRVTDGCGLCAKPAKAGCRKSKSSSATGCSMRFRPMRR